MTWRRLAGTAVFGMLLAGCTPVPSTVAPPTKAPAPSPSPSPPAVVQQPLEPPPAVDPLPPTPSATGFDEAVAVSCAGKPSADRVVALVRSKGLLTGATGVTVQTGPLCAGSWQYTVLTVKDREPLQVVSEGPSDGLRLVAAGTEVCSAIRSSAPPGIVSVAQCG